MSKIIVLMGAPGAGKGTQARLLQERLGLPQISTGDILRAKAQQHDALADEIRAVQASGKLASDDLVIRVVEERTAQEDCRNGYVLDGFPRTIPQAEMLEKLATEQGHEILAILIDVPYEMLEKRAIGRRSCPVCGEIYNIYFKPPRNDEMCDLHPDVKLEHRADDTPNKIRVRLETYDKQTRPLVEYYERGRLRRIDGTQSKEAIYEEILNVLREEERGSFQFA
ncbi:MAG TPA: nucleoside monophosphate kinase [Pyrinomonadaceae bacterium]|nr:nucleoside monophosphate kinase [Pyrinomonadaceae bacterium]